MKSKHFFILFILLIFSLFLSACAGGAATAASSWPGLTVDGETAYLAYNQHVYAINIADGKERWRYPLEANNKISFYTAPVMTPDGQLIVGGYDHVLYSVDPQTGKENWSFKEAKNRYIGSPLVNDAGIFAPAADDHLYAIDFQGKLLWSFQTKGAQWAQPVSSPTCECIYLPSMDHHLYAINASDGAEVWKTEDLGGSMVGSPAYGSDGTLYVGTFNNEILAISSENGVVLWRKPTDGWVWGGPAIKDGTLYFGDLSGVLYAMDASNGKILWKLNPETGDSSGQATQKTKPDGPIVQTPLLTDELIYFTTRVGSIFGVSYSGETKFFVDIHQLDKSICGDPKNTKVRPSAKLFSSPMLSGDKILVAPTEADELLYALDANGKPIWCPFIPEKK
jgi:outer membrane protein assembly factor BamB